MIWGSVWGLTGMVLAVPMTAVARIYLQDLEHPLPRYFAAVLEGREEDDRDGGRESSSLLPGLDAADRDGTDGAEGREHRQAA